MNGIKLYAAIAIVLLLILNIIVGYLDFKTDHKIIHDDTTNLDTTAFNNPSLANKIMELLYEPKPIEKRYLNHEKGGEMKLKENYLGLTQDQDYCHGSREWASYEAQTFFKKKRIFSDYKKDSLLRKDVIGPMKADVQPDISIDMPSWLTTQRLNDINDDVQIFFTEAPLHLYQEVDKNFACFLQEYNHIPGAGSLFRKDIMHYNLKQYIKKFKENEVCFDSEKYFLPAYALNNAEECKNFFKYLKSEEYELLKEEYCPLWIEKDLYQNSRKNLKVIQKEEEDELKAKYENGKLCSSVGEPKLLQRYVSQPLLIHKKKFEIRGYVLIASTNPLIVYFYNNGIIRFALRNYGGFSKKTDVHFPRTEISSSLIKKAGKGGLYGMDVKELKALRNWDIKRLAKHLWNIDKVKSKTWMANTLLPEMEKAVVHLIKMSQDTFLQKSQFFEFFAIDFILDDDLNIWYMGFESNPNLEGKSQKQKDLFKKMLEDMFEIIHKYLRSRLRHVINITNELTNMIDVVHDKTTNENNIIIPNIITQKDKFTLALKNKLYKSDILKKNNGFNKIIDENYDGYKRYNSLIPSSCYKNS